MSAGQNVTCRKRISEKYPVGIDSIHLNARNVEIHSTCVIKVPDAEEHAVRDISVKFYMYMNCTF
jgi:hypothetical protein